MIQDKINIGEISVPIIIDEDITYYPISFVMSKVLLKKTSSVGLQKEYHNYINRYDIDYGINTGGIQNVSCVSEDGLKLVLSNSKIGRLNVDQKKAMNLLLEYLHMDVISEDDRFIKRVSDDYISKYNIYIQDCITHVLENNPDIIWQKCTKCGNYYPYHLNFFRENQHGSKEYPLYTFCRECTWTSNRSKDFIEHPDIEFRIIYYRYGDGIYELYKSHDVISIYEHWLGSGGGRFMPKSINNKEDKLEIIKHMYDNGKFKDYEDLNNKSIKEVCGFALPPIGLKETYEYVLGVSISEYKNILNDFEGARIIIDKYINENDIIIEDKYNFNYHDIVRKCSLTGFLDRCCNNDMLEFIMKYYDNKYPSYKFKGGFKKYWEVKENRIKALKYFIEEDMKIPIDKVPLYITLTALRNKGDETMYNVCKKYYSSLFEWINEVYPERFDPKDFDIHYVRNDFDSIEEAEVHDKLKERFKNGLIYNPNNTDRTIKINGKVPDWFLFTNKMCYIVEYFGLNMDRNTSNNSRIIDYKEKTENKMEIYDELDGYGKIYIFPEDLENNFKGLMDKLELIL